MEAENIVHSDSMSPASLGICEKLFRRWELKTSLTEGSARRSQQTLTIRLGLPGAGKRPSRSPGVNSNTWQLSWGAKQAHSHTSSPPLTLGNSRVVEGPAPLKELGSRAPSYAWRDWVVEAPLPRLLPKPHCTGPSWTFLRVVSLLEGGPTSPFRAEPGRVPSHGQRLPGHQFFCRNFNGTMKRECVKRKTCIAAKALLASFHYQCLQNLIKKDVHGFCYGRWEPSFQKHLGLQSET
ncbi:hypothetical protein L3Q82_004673 [Scortum barcoo]|uniref:Uncharacterized protein n=1 Tax=Scortum barcoo TaxID=214431 RepID=A0ACB8VGT9_9TELE|nr:hypothetical protein L3Q82_004673 [Scortum barcoo]